MEYTPLDDARDEIRLLTLKPPSSPFEALKCTLEHVSLLDLTEGYQHHTKLSIHGSSLTTWLAFRGASGASSSEVSRDDDMVGQVPGEKDYRFQWGDFASLSYTWGSPHHTRSILLNDVAVQVTTNLEAALRALRSTAVFAARYMLWVDALCINQKDLGERERQVKKMRHIYSTSWAVFGWIGEDRDGSGQALDLIDMLASVYEDVEKGWALRDRFGDNPGRFASGAWVALEKLMLRGYWERLWVIQELILSASRARIVCGRRSLSWMTFCYGIGAIHKYLWAVKDRLLEYDLMSPVAGALDGQSDSESPSNSIQRLVDQLDLTHSIMTVGSTPLKKSQIRNTASTQAAVGWNSGDNLKHVYKDLWRLSEMEMGGESKADFYELLHVAKSSRCRDLRDKIYGLLGLMDPELSRQIIPDYTINPRELFISVARAIVSNSGCLDILREGFAWSEIGVPSWVPDWTWSGRVRDNRPRIPYRASGDLPASYAYAYDGSLLECQGFIFDQINGLGAHEVSRFRWPEESIANGERHTNAYGSAAATRAAFYRALIMDRKELGKASCGSYEGILYLPSRTTTGIEEFERLQWNHFALDGRYYTRWENWRKGNKLLWVGDRYLDEYFSDTIPEGASEGDYWDAYQSWTRTVTGRRLLTTMKGYFGWGPDFRGDIKEQIGVGDLICFVFGCSVPLVVRATKGDHYQVVGEAYVQGLMNGEALELLKSSGGQARNIIFY